MTRDEAADELASMLFEVGIEGGITALFDSLHNPVGTHKQTWAAINQWYEGQNDEVKGFIQFLVREATVLAVFGVAVNFDGASAYRVVGEHPAEFSVALRVYRSLADVKSHVPNEIIEVCPNTSGPDVHDLLIDLVDNDNPSSA
jgi:hypothetical protein